MSNALYFKCFNHCSALQAQPTYHSLAPWANAKLAVLQLTHRSENTVAKYFNYSIDLVIMSLSRLNLAACRLVLRSANVSYSQCSEEARVINTLITR